MRVLSFFPVLLLTIGAWPQVALADDIETLRQEIRSSDAGKAVEAARRLGEDPSKHALEVIVDELAIGAPPKVQAALLDGLAGRKDAAAVEVLGFYAGNRNPELRKKAIVLLNEINDARTVPLLIAALSDAAADVRMAAARALAARKERAATDAFIKLLQHKEPVAAKALGAIGGPEVARQLGELIGQIPDGLLAETLGALLERSDFGPDPIRVEVVKVLGKVPGNDSTAALTDYVSATEKDKTRPSRLAAQKILSQRGGR